MFGPAAEHHESLCASEEADQGSGISEAPGENKEKFGLAGCNSLTAPEICPLQN